MHNQKTKDLWGFVCVCMKFCVYWLHRQRSTSVRNDAQKWLHIQRDSHTLVQTYALNSAVMMVVVGGKGNMLLSHKLREHINSVLADYAVYVN